MNGRFLAVTMQQGLYWVKQECPTHAVWLGKLKRAFERPIRSLPVAHHVFGYRLEQEGVQPINARSGDWQGTTKDWR
jgi:hypothetical protein